jgi:hypothetical protein
MVSLIAATAKADHVSLFHRFDLMRHWHETEHLPFKAFVSPDGLHMNDWSYACLAKALGLAIRTEHRPLGAQTRQQKQRYFPAGRTNYRGQE